MHPAGQCSWRVGIESSSSLLDIALFTRDACGLDVPADARVPPPVATTVRDRRDALAPALRSPAGAQWLSWWVALVAQVGAVQLGSLVLPASTHQRLETLAALDQGLFDWPDLDALATRPALRKAVRAVGAEARRWSGEQRRKVASRRSTRRRSVASDRGRRCLHDRAGREDPRGPGLSFSGQSLQTSRTMWSQFAMARTSPRSTWPC